MNDDFRDLLTALADAGARYLVVGAYALAAHGFPRTTEGLDVWVEPSPENAKRVWRALALFGAPLHDMHLGEQQFTEPGALVQLGLPPYRINIQTSVSGLTFAEGWAGRTESELMGVPVPVLGRNELIRNKRAAGRPRDLSDIEALGG